MCVCTCASSTPVIGLCTAVIGVRRLLLLSVCDDSNLFRVFVSLAQCVLFPPGSTDSMIQ